MSTTLNDEKYETFQEHVLNTIVRSIKRNLEEKNLDEDLIYDLVGDIAFQVCAIIDGNAVMEVEGEAVLPFLAFSKSLENRNDLIVNEGGSYMHEMVFGAVDDIFEEDDEDEDE